MHLSDKRRKRIASCLDLVRALNDSPMTRPQLEHIKTLVVDLANQQELFPLTDFPPPTSGHSVLYRLAQDPDDRLALYLQTGLAGNSTPPHNHATWAVIASITGSEENILYRRLDDGAREGFGAVESFDHFVVKPGAAIALMPTDIHSIRLGDPQPAMHLHIYGMPLEKMTDRVWFDIANGTTAHFEAHPNIVDARP